VSPQSEWDYSSVGGLKREIEAVKEVVDLAVNSPKLFAEFGTGVSAGFGLLSPLSSLCNLASFGCAQP